MLKKVRLQRGISVGKYDKGGEVTAAKPAGGFLRNAWGGVGGCRDLFRVAYPLFFFSASTIVMQFCDRKFLGNCSTNAMAAALPAGHLVMSLSSLFFSMLCYTGTLTAQYHGAGLPAKCVDVLWSGVRAALLCAVVEAFILPILGTRLLGYSLRNNQALLELAAPYFMALAPGMLIQYFSAPFYSFYSGRGKTAVVAAVNMFGAALNIFLDWVMIFGKFGCPALGIVGAGVATSISQGVSTAVIVLLALLATDQKIYPTGKWRSFDLEIFKKLFCFGLPSGFQLFSNNLKFSAVLLLVGTMGELALAASTIPLAVDTLSFLPVMAVAEANMIICGQLIGGGDRANAVRSTCNALLVNALYSTAMLVMYVFFSHPILRLFAPDQTGGTDFSTIERYSYLCLLTFGACEIIDTVRWSVGSLLRAAGDTKALMFINMFASWVVCVPGFWVLTQYTKLPITLVWPYFLVFSLTESAIVYLRYRNGAWRRIKLVKRRSAAEKSAQ